MTAADKIEAARALIEPLTGYSPGPWEVVTDLPAIAIAAGNHRAVQTPNQNNYRHFGRSEPWLGIGTFSNAALIAAAPALRDTVAALADLADAQAQEIARLMAENERMRKMVQPEWFYAAYGYESEACRESVWEVLDEDYFWDRPKTGQHVVEINVATPLPSVWAAVRFKCECDDNMIVTEHASEAEARAALGDAQ